MKTLRSQGTPGYLLDIKERAPGHFTANVWRPNGQWAGLAGSTANLTPCTSRALAIEAGEDMAARDARCEAARR